MGTVMFDRPVTVVFVGLMLFVAIHCYQDNVTDDSVMEKTSHRGENSVCKCDPCRTGPTCKKSIEENSPKFHQKYQLVEINEDAVKYRRPLKYNSTTYPGEKGCPCPYFVYEITEIENSNELNVFEIDASTGNIFVTQDLPYELFKITVTARNTKTGASDDTKLTVMTKTDSKPNQFHPLEQQGYHHHIQKRSVIPATDPSFTVTKLTSAGTLEVGGYARFQLKVLFPANAIDMLIELFAPDNETTVMILCDVTVTKGSNLATALPHDYVEYDSKGDITKPDRAIINLGQVTNSQVNTVDESASSIIIEYEAVVVYDPAITPGSFWISLGAAYNLEEYIWVAIQDEMVDNSGNPAITDDPTFTITGPTNMAIGGYEFMSLDIAIPYAYDSYVLKTITPVGKVDVMSVCYMRFDGFGTDFQCGNDPNSVTLSTVPDAQGRGYQQGTADLGSLLYKRARDGNPPGTSVTVTALLHMYNQPSMLGTDVSMGIIFQQGSTDIWAGGWNITLDSATPSGYPVPVLNSYTTSLSTPWLATIGEPFWIRFKIQIPPPTTARVAGDFELELFAPFVDNAPVFQVCKLEILSVGEDIPCLKISDLATEYTTRETGGSYADKALIKLGFLTNMDQYSIPDDDIIEVEAILTPLAAHAAAVLASSHDVILGVTVSGAYTQIMSTSVVLNAASSMVNVNNATAPTFAFSHDGSSDVPVTGQGLVNIDMTTTNNILYPELDLEFLMPSDTTHTYFHVCRLAIVSNGKNVPCLTPEWANKNVQIFSQYEDKLIDRIKMSLGPLCNYPFSGDAQDDVTRFALYYKILDIPAVTADSQHWIDAGILYSTNYLWVGRLSTTAKRGQTFSPSTPIYTALQRNDTLGDLPLNNYARFSLLLKIPSGDTVDLKIKAISSAQGFDICSLRVIAAGDNLPCLTEEGVTKTETLWANGGTATVIAHYGVVRNFGSGSMISNDIYDIDSAIIEIIGHSNQNVAPGTYSLTVETYVDTAMSTVSTETITGINVVDDQSSLPTARTTAVAISLSVGEIGSGTPNLSFVRGQVQRILLKAVIPEGSLYRLEFSFVIPAEFIGKLEICDAAILYVGENLPCVDPMTNPVITSLASPFKDTAKWDFDYVHSTSAKPGDEVANSIVFEAFVRLVPNDMPVMGETVTVTGTVKTFDELTVESVDFTVADISTFTDSVKTSDGISNITLLSVTPAPPISMTIGENLTVTATVTVPVNSSSRFLFDVNLPGDGRQACLTVSAIRVENIIRRSNSLDSDETSHPIWARTVCNSSAGRNVYCVDQHVNSKGVVYTPVYSDTIGAGTNNYGYLDFGIVTNAGLSHRRNEFIAGDDDVAIEADIQMCDCSTSAHLNVHQLSFGNRVADHVFIHSNDVQATRNHVDELPDIAFDLIATADSTSSNVILGGTVYHTSLSKGECRNLTVLVELPLYMAAPVSIVTSSTKSYTYATDKPELIEISFDDFYFTDVFSFNATLSIDNSLVLPSGFSAADTRFYKWTVTNFYDWTPNFDSEDWFPDLQLSEGELTYSVDAGSGTSCHTPLGLSNNAIQDCQITGTKGRDSTGEAKNGRKGSSSAWKPVVVDGTNRNRYFEVYFGNKYIVSEIDIEQNAGMPDYATEIETELSLDGRAWFGKETFSLPMATLSTVILRNNVDMRYMRIKVNNDSSNGNKPEFGIGFEFYGCQGSSDVAQTDLCTNAAATFDDIPQATRNFLVDDNNKVYACTIDTSSEYSGICMTSTDGGSEWTLLDNIGGMIGFDPQTGDIYGYAQDIKTVMMSTDSGATFEGTDDGNLGLITLTSAIEVPETDTPDLEQSYPRNPYTMGSWGAGVYGRECYNYKESPHVRDCDQGCCGDDHEEYCCDATLQIVGCVIGGVVLIGVIVAIVFYCYRQKTRHRRQQRTGLLANNVPAQPAQIPVIPGHGARRMHVMGGGHLNIAQYNPQYVHSVQPTGPAHAGFYYPGSTMYNQPPMAPTAPMPPPYAVTALAPPPYAPNKPVPPPPEYNSVVNHGFKYDDQQDNMPPPSS